MMWPTLLVVLLAATTSDRSDSNGADVLASATHDMEKLNEYILADKENEINVESL